MVTKFFDRLKNAVKSTKENLKDKIEVITSVGKKIDENVLEDLEAILIKSDIGVATTEEIIERARREIERDKLNDRDALLRIIKEEIKRILVENSESVESKEIDVKPQVIFVVGVNGVGKTTTIGKLTYALSLEGKRVIVCASDTFRAAAIEQLEVWAKRSGAEIVKKSHGSDPAAVLYDSLEMAKKKDADVVIVDTAGRLHTKVNLMKELEKMSRIASKKVEGAPHEVLLVIDATTGQNGLIQAKSFLEKSGVTGIVVTKLDGTAKGGIIVSIKRELNIPIKWVGIGEKMEDLIRFDADDFVESLFS